MFNTNKTNGIKVLFITKPTGALNFMITITLTECTKSILILKRQVRT